MPTRLPRLTLSSMLLSALVATAFARGSSAQDDPSKPPPPDAERVYAPPDRPLDERIDPSKVTEIDPPPLPEWVLLPLPPSFSYAATPEDVPLDADAFERALGAIERGLAFLRETQGEPGGWMKDALAAPTDEGDRPSPVEVAVTALAVKAFAQHGKETLETPEVHRALRLILDAQNDDGSFDAGGLANYVTAVTAGALASIEDRDVYDQLQVALQWLQTNQWDQTEGLSARQDWFGGAGYGNRRRPDLSNTQMMLDALYDAGLSPSERAFQRALAFISRAQNLKQTNPAEWAGTDGGFVYTPANGGESFGSEAAGEGRSGELVPAGEPRSLRSYGSMTYAGFKSMLYAGLSPDDVRVRAAFDWVRRHWTFEENPGLDQQGLYYYYHTMARALRVAQQDVITDVDGNAHRWREEMIDAILRRQRSDGSWINDADRWLEGHPELATIYAVLALQEILK